MNQYIANPLSGASIGTLTRITEELQMPFTEDINILYAAVKNSDNMGQGTFVADAAYNADYMVKQHSNFTLAQMREHLEGRIACGFNKIMLSNNIKNEFLSWSERVENLNENASPFEIYYSAVPRLLSVLGR
jgi:hypothetical protein